MGQKQTICANFDTFWLFQQNGPTGGTEVNGIKVDLIPNCPTGGTESSTLYYFEKMFFDMFDTVPPVGQKYVIYLLLF